MKHIHTVFGITLLFSLFLLAINAWGEPYISFYSNRTGNRDIYIIDTNGENLRNLTNHPASDCCATWAPDGRSFAFMSRRDGKGNIYIMKVGETEARRLTNHPEQDSAPAWSPDGKWIAFQSNRTGKSQIYKIDINGKNLQRLTNQGNNYTPAWSPDGKLIAFYSDQNEWGDVYVMDSDGKGVRRIKNEHGGGSRSPAWSPDGKQIAFDISRQGNGIFIMDVDGGNSRRMSPPLNWSYNPAWSPDDKWIAYEAEIENPWGNPNVDKNIYIVSVKSGKRLQITHHPGQNGEPAWVPEGFFSVSPTANTKTTLWGRLKQTEPVAQ
ncbi:PD40 domain-containing protein [Candidatus Poribacteria bacterium]|nr:PD40 domain-containing protein [Candidatus Poribacteria bacterium]